MKQYFAYTLILIGIILLLDLLYTRSQASRQTRIFSPYSVLSSSWEMYKTQYINADGRVIDTTQNNITTSEGQSYALLRAVWMDDKSTFDRVWSWTKNNLQKRNDHLFGWRWGKTSTGHYGFLENGGNNPATDADEDISLALIFAANRWHESSYSAQARFILHDIWNEETAVAGGKRYVIAGTWAQNQTQLIINPSYFVPYAWRIFASVDKQHDWNSLISPAYSLLSQSSDSDLDLSSSDHLPPNWINLNRRSGTISATNISGLTTDYSYDAIRVPWRIAIDYLWNGDPQAKNYLQNHFHLLQKLYKQSHKLPTGIAHDGKIVLSQESPAMYATALGYFMFMDKKDADEVYQNKIVRLYSNDANTFNKTLSYYDQNWLWFGAALYSKYLKPIT